jgi:heme exporter protein D
MPWFLQVARVLFFLGRGIKQASGDARAADEAKWRTPVGHLYPEPWNELDPPNTLSACEADICFPEKASDRHAAVCLGIFASLIWFGMGYLGHRLQFNWLLVAGIILALLTSVQTIAARRHCLEEVTENMRRQRRQVKFNLAVDEGTACLNCRRGKPKKNQACPSCGFNQVIYSAEAAAKKATRAVMKAAVRLTAKAACLTAKATWEITKGTAKVLWWSLTPTKKRTTKIPTAV